MTAGNWEADQQGSGTESRSEPDGVQNAGTEGGKENLIKSIFSWSGMALFAKVLISVGIIFKLIHINQFGLQRLEHGGEIALLAFKNMRDHEQSFWIMSSVADWALFLGIGYYLFKVFLIGVRQTTTAVKKGLE